MLFLAKMEKVIVYDRQWENMHGGALGVRWGTCVYIPSQRTVFLRVESEGRPVQMQKDHGNLIYEAQDAARAVADGRGKVDGRGVYLTEIRQLEVESSQLVALIEAERQRAESEKKMSDGVADLIRQTRQSVAPAAK